VRFCQTVPKPVRSTRPLNAWWHLYDVAGLDTYGYTPLVGRGALSYVLNAVGTLRLRVE